MHAESEATPTSSESLDRRFTRNPLLTVIYCGDDEVVVKHGSRSRFSKNIKDSGRTRLLGRILRHGAAPVSLAELRDRRVIGDGEVDDAARLVDYLRGQEVLVDPTDDLARVYLDTVLGRGRPLAERTVGVVGAGYLGSRIASGMARVGVGRLLALDDRRVERESVDRAFFDLAPAAVAADRSLVECLGDHLAGYGFEGLEAIASAVDDEAAVRELAAGCDFLVVALEAFSSRTLHLANSVAIELGRPWVSVYMDGSEALVGPLYVPGETCCYNEFEVQHEATLGPGKDGYLLYKETLDGAGLDGSHFTLPPHLDVAAGLAVTGVVRYLLSGRSHLVGRAVRIDFERLSIDYEAVLRLPRCPACSPSRPGYRHLFM